MFLAKPGTTHFTAHEIHSKSDRIVNQQPYGVPEAHKETTGEEIKKMLELGVIEESHSAWASPIVLFPNLICHTESAKTLEN